MQEKTTHSDIDDLTDEELMLLRSKLEESMEPETEEEDVFQYQEPLKSTLSGTLLHQLEINEAHAQTNYENVAGGYIPDTLLGLERAQWLSDALNPVVGEYAQELIENPVRALEEYVVPKAADVLDLYMDRLTQLLDKNDDPDAETFYNLVAARVDFNLPTEYPLVGTFPTAVKVDDPDQLNQQTLDLPDVGMDLVYNIFNIEVE